MLTLRELRLSKVYTGRPRRVGAVAGARDICFFIYKLKIREVRVLMDKKYE